MSKKAFGWIVVILVIILVLVAANKKADDGQGMKMETSNKGPVKIGVIAPITGEAASIGEAVRAAAEVAVEEINAAGGISGSPVVAVYEDGKCGSSAASAAQKLMNVDKVDAIIGGACSGETASFVKTAMDQKVPVFSYCSSAPTLTGSGKYFFRNYPSDSYSAVFASDYLYNKLSAKKVAILYHVSDWGSALEKTFTSEYQKLGGTVVASEGVQQTSKDFRTQLAKIKASNPDYIYMLLYSEGGAVAVTQAKELGITQKLLFPEVAEDPKFIAAVSGKADILYSIARVPDNADFVAKITAKTKGTTAPACTPQVYDAVKITLQTMAKVGTDPDAFAAEMHKVSYNGVSGQISFDTNGDLANAEFIVKRIADGKSTEVK